MAASENGVVSPEMINHPSHYKVGDLECIDVMLTLFGKEEVAAFCKCNAFKYMWRSGKKDPQKELEDYRKAEWYLSYMNKLKSDEQNNHPSRSSV